MKPLLDTASADESRTGLALGALDPVTTNLAAR